jgi:hypothetical protein
MNLAAKIGHDALLADHPFVARLSRLMKIGAAGLTGLELIMVSERLVKKRKDLIVVGNEYRNLCFVKDGYAIRHKVLRSGKRQILNVILPATLSAFPSASLIGQSTQSLPSLI